MKNFPASVQKAIGFYVYAYVDPRDEAVFYIGKGVGNRAFAHLAEAPQSAKGKRLRAIRDAGGEPRIDILAHGLEETVAAKLEAAAIDLLGKQQLTNLVRGVGSVASGRMTAQQVAARYAPTDAVFKHPTILIRINKLFRYGMSEIELYDATRGVWKLDPKKATGRLALAVFDGVVQEVYRPQHWLPAGSTLSTRGKLATAGRYEFVGNIAEPSVRRQYLYKSVAHLLPQGNQNPIRYVDRGVA